MKKLAILTLFLLFTSTIIAQDKKSLTFDDILKWNRITEKMISNDGNFVVYKNEPWKGDPVLKITSVTGSEKASVIGGTNAQITANSGFAIFTIKPESEKVRELKLKKTKKEDMPGDELAIFNLGNNELTRLENLKSFKLPDKWGDYVAYQLEPAKVAPSKDDEEKSKDKKEKAENQKNGYTLYVKNLSSGEITTFPFVSSFDFAEENHSLVFISTGDDKDFEPGIYLFDIDKNVNTAIFNGKADYKQLSISEKGNKIAFLADLKESKTGPKNYALYYWNGSGTAAKVLDNTDAAIPDGWEISSNGNISFAKNTERIFFGTAPIRPEKDTTILEEEIPVLDIWVWDEPVLHTQQLNTKSRDLRKTYMAVYHADRAKMVQIENENYDRISLIDNGDANQVYAYSNVPYAIQTMWEGSPAHADFYLVDIFTGDAKMIKKDVRASASVSPAGKYLYWYNAMDTSWNTYNMATVKEFKLTNPKLVQGADELNDIPNPPRDYGDAGWLKGDEAFLVYDRFDIWQLDPDNKKDPVNLTLNGKELNTEYRIINFDAPARGRFMMGGSNEGIDPNETAYLTGHNELSRADGFYKMSLKKPNVPKELISGNYALGRPIKAKDKEVLVYTKEDFKTYPNLLVTDFSFKKSQQISDAAPQQKDFFWGDVELLNWTSLDGRKLQGTLHKPENFDPNKKYPMIVNFYEKSSQGLYSYRMPEAHRSTVDYHYYTSNGYLVFNPDIYYKTGYPGEDAFNCVMPGVTALIEKGFVEENHIAAQGHSWGGYQVAYLATRTNLFAAIESGAPVVNMFSAYGGIRWGSGMNRSFQYEHTQSRIGKSIWESPLRFIENSPIFTMDKVQTPILIMHNDDDGAVPWYQGIEYFTALRRMGKPAWLLNYNEADHWPLLVRDKYDFQIRMAQFFDHFLKGAPMPLWMKEGIPAVDKGFYEMKYELVK